MPFNLGLGLGIQRGGYLFSPASLFTASEPGVIYDASDLTTLFQDTAGTQPVTTAGQTVALALDKSKGLVLGPELVTNGDFSSGTGWTLGSGWSIASGQLVGSAVPAFTVASQATAALVAGRTYEIRYDITSFTSGSARLSFTGGTAVTGTNRASTGSFRELLVANSGHTTIAFGSAGAGFTGTIDNISVRELSGNHATQSILASRPLYQVDASGRGYLLFDGVDDFLVTPTITPGTDKAQVFAGVRKLSDAAAGIVVEHSADANANNGTFNIVYPRSGSINEPFATSKGTVQAVAANSTNTFPAPRTDVITLTGDISGDSAIQRLNGSQRVAVSSDQGTGNFLAYPLYIGRRGGTTLPFNGRLYGLVVRFGPNLDAATIAATESWLNTKTGAY